MTAAAKIQELSPREATIQGLTFTDLDGDLRGYCYACGRAGFKLNGAGRLSRHGYRRPGWGYDVGGCPGSGLTPEETLHKAIAGARRDLDRLDSLLADSGKLAALAISIARREGSQRDKWGSRPRSWQRRSAADKIRAYRAGHLDMPRSQVRRDREWTARTLNQLLDVRDNAVTDAERSEAKAAQQERQAEQAAKAAAKCSASGQYLRPHRGTMSDYAKCPECGKPVSLTRLGKLRAHKA